MIARAAVIVAFAIAAAVAAQGLVTGYYVLHPSQCAGYVWHPLPCSWD